MTTPSDAVLRFFQEVLADVRFPGLDAAVLTTAAAKVREADAEVARCALALEAARAGLAHAQDALCAKSERALAYARIYAEDDPALRAQLDAIGGPPDDAASPAPQRRRGRPPRAASQPVPLFEASDSA